MAVAKLPFLAIEGDRFAEVSSKQSDDYQ